MLKTTLMAAASLGVAATASAHASDPMQTDRAPVELVQMQTHAAIDADTTAVSPVAKKVGLLAAAAAISALLVRIIGWRAISGAITRTGAGIKSAAETVARVPVAAAKAVARATSGPVRYAMLMASMGLTAFVGVGIYDVEWLGGLVIGAALVGLSWYGARRTAHAFAFQRNRSRADVVRADAARAEADRDSKES